MRLVGPSLLITYSYAMTLSQKCVSAQHHHNKFYTTIGFVGNEIL